MKKLLIVLLLSPLFFDATAASDVTTKNTTEVVMTRAQKRAELKKLTARLQEIHALAIAQKLTTADKKQLREEVQNIDKQLQKMEGVYLYLSLTAILIILLLIILL
jgi:hypothetical protein